MFYGVDWSGAEHPVIVRMILPCSEESALSCDAVGAVCVSLGLCQIIAT